MQRNASSVLLYAYHYTTAAAAAVCADGSVKRISQNIFAMLPVIVVAVLTLPLFLFPLLQQQHRSSKTIVLKIFNLRQPHRVTPKPHFHSR